MQRILTTLTAAAILALAVTTEANAGHHMQHNNSQPNNNHGMTSISLHSSMHNDNHQMHVDHRGDHRVRFLRSNFRDFRYCCWYPSCDTYLFWYPSDDCWYYWCASRGCYLPYDQITVYPPQANVIPQVPGGLPPLLPGGNANGPTNGNGANGPPMGNDGPPNMPPPDGQK